MIRPRAVARADGKQRALVLVSLMILASWLPMGSPLIVTAHAGVVAEWGSEGQNDTGWIQLNATHSGVNSQTATGNLLLDFAPGATLDNLTFEIRVNGSDGLWVDQPQILLPDAPASILDWRGLGTLGQQNNFDGSDPHSGRLSPNSDANAGWVLPGGATVTDVVIEALRPADPYVSMQRIDVNVVESDVHPSDGRLYIAIGDALIQVDSQNNPPVIEIFDMDEEIYTFSIDDTNQVIFVSSIDEDEETHLHAFSLSDSGYLGEIETSGLSFTALADAGFGTLWASDGDGLYSGTYQNSAGTPTVAWTRVVDLAVGSGNIATDLLVLSTDVWIATEGSGLYHYDASNGAAQHYDTQNTLPSDDIRDLEMAGTHLLIATADSGIARRDVVTNSWLATWTDGNWLASNDIASLSAVDGWVHILAGDTVHTYNTTSFSFSSAYTMQDFSLSRDTGNTLIPWPSGGTRAPLYSTVLVGDGSGTFTILHPHMQGHGANQGTWNQMVLATGPSEDNMQDAVELNGIVYIAAGEKIERFNLNQNRWMNPLTGGGNPYASEVVCIMSDGTDIFIGTQDAGIIQITVNGTQILSQRAAQWETTDGLSSDEVSDMAYESGTGQIVAIHPFAGLSIIDPSNATVAQSWTEFNGLNSNDLTALAVRGGIAYAGTINDGIERIDVLNSTRLNPWTSTGMDDVDSMPIAVDGNTLYLGLYGYGVIVYDLTTGEQTDTWQRTGGGGPGGGNNQIPSNNVRSLAVISSGTVLVGTDNGGAQHTSAGWTNMGNTGNEFANEFYDWDFDNQYIYAATETGACQWSRSNLAFQKCWDDNPDGLPGEFTQSIELISGNMWVGGVQGAGVIDIANDTVIKAWEAGVASGNAKVIVIGDVAYLGYDGMGILRYDLSTDEWLSPWDAVNSNLIESNGVTAMVLDTNPNRIWVGGDMGLNLIDVFNETLEEDWDLGNNGGGLQLPNQEPAELAIIGNTLYYLQSRFGNNGFSSNDNVYRYNIFTRSQQPSIDVGASEGYTALVHGMGVIDDIVHFGISPTQWWLGDGHLVRWNHTSSSWMDGIESEGQVERVNADFAGDCHPTPTNCHLYAAYGNTPLHQVDMNGNLVRSWDSTVIEGPIRGIVTWEGAVLFGTEDGVYRYNYTSNTWISEWTSNNGLPNNVEDAVFSMEVIGDDLWIATMATGGWNRNSKILQLNGTSGQWTVHDVGSGQVPEGYGADIGLCDGIVHVAINRYGWGTQGGVARYDLNSGSWLNDWTQGQGGLPHDNPVAITCDEGYDVVYIGFEEGDGSISRYDYVNQQFLATIDEDDNVISEPIFPGAMHHFGGGLLVGHYDAGGITYIATTGQIITNIIPFSQDSEATSISPVPGGQAYEFAIGRAGGSSGYNRVDNLDVNGLNVGYWDILATLSSGRIAEMIGNSTHVWVTPIDDLQSELGSAILEGQRLPNGTIEWTRAWNFNSLIINELVLDDQTLWITTAGLGLVTINLTTGVFNFTPPPLHYQMDEMAWYGNELVVGLMGTGGTAAGVQRFDTINSVWGPGRLAAGLPSNVVLDFEQIADKVYIATLFGIGVWNLTADDWEDPMTTADGLPSPFITHLDSDNGVLIIGTPSGLLSYDPMHGIGLLYGRNQGLVGDSISGIAKVNLATTGVTTYFVSHNGDGPTRPGFSEVNPVHQQGLGPNHFGFTIQDTTLVDILPSNKITALASDWWGVHIATDAEPLMHWNAATSEMEQGTPASALASWPIQHMDSDGQNIIAISSLGVNRIDVTGSFHTSSSLISYAGLNRGTITSNGIFIVGQDGLHVWSGHPSFIEKDRAYMLRADPLMINFGVGGDSLDATNLARPGNQITLIDSSNPVTLPEFGNPGPGNILLTQDMLTLTSPVSGAATWVSSSRLNYSGTWDLVALNPSVQTTIQVAIDNSVLSTAGRSLHIQLQSPQNGSIEVRLTYDWIRSESPSELIEIYDRPEDGGGVLIAQWTVTQDHTFYAYRIYLRPDSNWTTPPTSEDLLSTTWDARYSNWQRTSAELNTHAGQPLLDGTPYWAVIVIEYPDGSIGDPSAPIGPATPTDEIPTPPVWADAGPLPDGMMGDDGDLFVEWSACTELDADVTRIWASPIPITNALGLQDSIDFANEAGNNTSISLQEGRPYWVALTCVDEGGQHDPANAKIIGPVVPTGGINDFTPPAPVEDIDAWDTPDDEGGQINVSWTPNEEEDCAWYTIFATPVVSESPPVWADDAEIASVVANCSINGTIISEIAGELLVDQQAYWITVAASDEWGNVDHFNVTWVSTFSVQNNMGIVPPPRVADLAAWDHPDDTGNAVDVQWTPTNVTDFAFYVVWASEHPLDDVILKWNECKDNPASCGLMRITQQRQSFDEPMFVKMESAMYGTSLESSTASQIVPNQPIWVTVTVHDVKGNAFLTGLSDHMVMVTPIDNSLDEIAPDRLDEIEVTDRPDDNGNGLLLSFDYSDASDIDYYSVYVHDFPFTDVSSLTPSNQVPRDSPHPIELEKLSNGSDIVPGKMLWVAVVPVDTAGNAWNDQLNVVNAMAIDNGLEDALHLPEVEGLNATWNEAGTDIIVTWDPTTDSQVKGYLVHFSDQPYVDNRPIDKVTLVTEELIQTSEITLNATTWDLRNDQLWYISVVVSDGETNRFGVTPVEVVVWIPVQAEDEGQGDSTEEGSGAWWENLSVLEIALIISLACMILILSLVLVVRLRKPRFDPLDHATPNWELQIEDWSDTSADPPPLASEINFEETLLPAAASIKASDTPSQVDSNTNFASRDSGPSTDLDEIAEGLLNESESKSKKVDTSFLDDLL